VLARQRAYVRRQVTYGLVLLAMYLEPLLCADVILESGNGNRMVDREAQERELVALWRHNIEVFDKDAARLGNRSSSDITDSTDAQRIGDVVDFDYNMDLFSSVYVCGNTYAICKKLENLLKTEFAVGVVDYDYEEERKMHSNMNSHRVMNENDRVSTRSAVAMAIVDKNRLDNEMGSVSENKNEEENGIVSRTQSQVKTKILSPSSKFSTSPQFEPTNTCTPSPHNSARSHPSTDLGSGTSTSQRSPSPTKIESFTSKTLSGRETPLTSIDENGAQLRAPKSSGSNKSGTVNREVDSATKRNVLLKYGQQISYSDVDEGKVGDDMGVDGGDDVRVDNADIETENEVSTPITSALTEQFLAHAGYGSQLEAHKLAMDLIPNAVTSHDDDLGSGVEGESRSDNDTDVDDGSIVPGDLSVRIQDMKVGVDFELTSPSKPINVPRLELPSSTLATVKINSMNKAKGGPNQTKVPLSPVRVSSARQLPISSGPPLSDIYDNIARIFPIAYSAVGSTTSTSTSTIPSTRNISARTLLESMQAQARLYEEWVEVMSDYSTVFSTDRKMRLGEESPHRSDEGLHQGGSKGLTYRVKSQRPEVTSIVKDVITSKMPIWEELPAGLGLGLSWNLLWTWNKPRLDPAHLLVWQRVNHFVDSKQLTRKDILKKNIQR